MRVEDYIKLGESKTLEFKENANSKAKILATVIAFSNASGGRIIVGIQDKTHHVLGVSSPHEVAESLVNMIHDSIEPRIIPNIEVMSFRNKHLVALEIYPSPNRPHFIRAQGKQNSTYIRIGSTTRLADQELVKIIERSALIQSFDEEICPGATLDDIDLDYTQEVFLPHRKVASKELISLGVLSKVRETITPTVGGMLLFSKERLRYFPDAWIQIGSFEGTDKTKITNTHKVTSPFPQAIDECLNILRNTIRVGLSIQEVRHEEVWEIPKIALREAIINAIVHTDYSLRGAPSRIAIFTDRIEIENSALLLGGLSIDDIKSGVSKLRNPVLGRVFFELGIIEQWGSGITRMSQACKEAGLGEPIFEEIGARIRVTLYKKKVQALNIDDVDRTILEFIHKNRSVSTHEVVSLVGLSRRTAITRLARLVDNGLLIEIALSLNDPKKRYELP